MLISQAASAIVELLNSQPATPAREKIEAVLRRRLEPAAPEAAPRSGALPPMSPAHAEHYRLWRLLIANYLRDFPDCDEVATSAAEIQAREDDMAQRLEEVSKLSERILATPARSWGDVLLIAEVAFWSQWPGTDPEGAQVQENMNYGLMSCGGICDEAEVRLIQAVFSVAGIGQFAASDEVRGA